MVLGRVIVLAGVGLFTGCASIFSGTQQSVIVRSQPAGALVKLDGVTRAVSPAVLRPSPRTAHTVRIERAGFLPVTVPVRRHLSGWFLANLLNGFIPGGLIDYSTGAVYELEPQHIDAELTPIGSRKTN